ncbi:hypothetical protein [Maridesulfovibrio hydrothermalis]|uniref:O-antigen polymerase n=1 Tax=Maridesulfovibrio hydrothermalis AM13 = DSM 14728 TaxID=1121451 RepID=L0R9A3_9BACT|nr:hypothetical protein [Maridesulfovibrio hydrothermalis]CCO22797.1 conserved membrane protein of unknown function [Maridesulfovibrio hydrothermalis AM13 = DSM 14728]
MSLDNAAVTASEFPIALFSLGLPLMLAAYGMNGFTAPYNLADILVTGLAVLGLLAEPFKNDRDSTTPLWFKAGIPTLLIVWISFTSFAELTLPLTEALPFLMEARPALYLLVAALWLTKFGPPKTGQLSFWSCWLAALICAEFIYRFFWQNLSSEPNFFGNFALTGPILLTGLCATLHNSSENKLSRIVILAGIFCALSRDISIAAVLVLLLFGPKGGMKKVVLVFFLLLSNYISLAPHELTILNRNDLPSYWLWFTILDLLANNPILLLTGFPASTPLPLSIPTSLWNLWHEQHHVWTDLGIYLFHITPFWLHLLTAWGLGGICIVAAIGTSIFRRYPSDMMAGLITAVTITGFFSPLFYAPASAIILIMGFICAAQPEVQSFSFE